MLNKDECKDLQNAVEFPIQKETSPLTVSYVK